MFDAMIDSIREDTVRMIFLAQVRTREEPKREQVARRPAQQVQPTVLSRQSPSVPASRPARMIRARAAAARSIRNAATSSRMTRINNCRETGLY